MEEAEERSKASEAKHILLKIREFSPWEHIADRDVSDTCMRQDGQWLIICRRIPSGDICCIVVDDYSGSLQFSNVRGMDVFDTMDEALEAKCKGCEIEAQIGVEALIGYFSMGNYAYVIAVKESRVDCKLPGGHEVKTVTKTLWIPISFKSNLFLNTTHVKYLKIMKQVPLENLHYYCETADITSPFPSPNVTTDGEREFIWNDFMKEQFLSIGLGDVPVVLLQGMAMCHEVYDIHLCLFARKSVINPGVRYYSRGLNAEGSPGNEMECELLLWRYDELKREYLWSSYLWRRGAVPIWWSTELKSSIAEPEIVIRNKPYEGADIYYKRLLQRYGPHPIRCVNMLKCAQGKDELNLSEAFHESVEFVRKRMEILISVANFDWHNSVKHLSLEGAVEALHERVRQLVMETGASHGELTFEAMESEWKGGKDASPGQSPSFLTRSVDNNGERVRPVVKSIKRQEGIIRFNCADSLDRTNIATFFVSLPLLVELSRLIDTHRPFVSNACPPEPWSFFSKPLSEIKSSIGRPFLSGLAELFVLLGDTGAYLYTGSRALYTKPLREFSPTLSDTFANSRFSNTLITLHRRYNNVLLDKERQIAFELFVGLNFEKYFLNSPGILQNVTAYPACLLKDVIQAMPSDPSPINTASNDDILRDSAVEIRCADGCTIIEVYMYLMLPCFVNGIAMTMRGEAMPEKFDLFIGKYMDSTTLCYQEVPLPIVESGTTLYFMLGGAGENGFGPLYEFNAEPSVEVLTRVVQLIFHRRGGDTPITLGHIRVLGSTGFGNPLDERDDFMKEERMLRLSEMDKAALADPVQKESATSTSFFRLMDLSRSPSEVQEDRKIAKRQLALPHQRYETAIIEKLKLLGNNTRKLTFADVLELESDRVGNSITVDKRNEILYKLQIKIEELNPNRFIFYRDKRVIQTIMKRAENKNKRCEICNTQLGFTGTHCFYCMKKFCSKCVEKARIIEYRWDAPAQVCLRCREILAKQEGLINEIKKRAPLLLSKRENAGLLKSFNRRYRHISSITPKKQPEHRFIVDFDMRRANLSTDSLNLSDSESNLFSLAEYPLGGILMDVPTDSSSHPIESILYPDDFLTLDCYWEAPKRGRSADIVIVLSNLSRIRKIELITDALGYTSDDIPRIVISTGTMLSKMERIAIWDLSDIGKGIAVGEKGHIVKPRDCIQLDLPGEGVIARIVSLEYTLPVRAPDFVRAGNPSVDPSANLIRSVLRQKKGSPLSVKMDKDVLAAGDESGRAEERATNQEGFSVKNKEWRHSRLVEPLKRHEIEFKSEDRVHIGRVRVIGEVVLEKQVNCTSGVDKPIKLKLNNVRISSATFKAANVDGRPKSVLLLQIENSKSLAGFTLENSEGTEYGSGIRELEVSVGNLTKGGLTLRRESTISLTIPLTDSGRTLVYHFEEPIQGNCARFSFSSNYGGRVTSPLLITLFQD